MSGLRPHGWMLVVIVISCGKPARKGLYTREGRREQEAVLGCLATPQASGETPGGSVLCHPAGHHIQETDRQASNASGHIVATRSAGSCVLWYFHKTAFAPASVAFVQKAVSIPAIILPTMPSACDQPAALMTCA